MPWAARKGLCSSPGFCCWGFVAIGSTPPRANMLILRGIASMDAPRGQLDDRSALEYARRLGYAGEVLDVAANPSQVEMAIERIRRDRWVKAIYGFSRRRLLCAAGLERNSLPMSASASARSSWSDPRA